VPSLGDRTDTFMDSFRRDREDYPAVRTATVLGSVDQTEINSTGAVRAVRGVVHHRLVPGARDARWDPMKKVIREVAFGDNRIDEATPGCRRPGSPTRC
jgi:hypothetical protein